MARGAGQLSLQLAQPTMSGRQRRKAAARASHLPRLSISPDEAAEMLGVSRDYLDEHILPELRTVRRGRRILIPVAELQRWLDKNAARYPI